MNRLVDRGTAVAASSASASLGHEARFTARAVLQVNEWIGIQLLSTLKTDKALCMPTFPRVLDIALIVGDRLMACRARWQNETPCSAAKTLFIHTRLLC